MKRMKYIAVAAVLVGLLAADAEAGIFRRFRYYRYTPTRTTVGTRVEGHTEATGTGTSVDGTPRSAPPTAKKPLAKPGQRVEGNTEATGTGTQVDGR